MPACSSTVPTPTDLSLKWLQKHGQSHMKRMLVSVSFFRTFKISQVASLFEALNTLTKSHGDLENKLRTKMLGLESWRHHFLAVWPRTNYLKALFPVPWLNGPTVPTCRGDGRTVKAGVPGQWSVPRNLAITAEVCMGLLYRLKQLPFKLMTC